MNKKKKLTIIVSMLTILAISLTFDNVSAHEEAGDFPSLLNIYQSVNADVHLIYFKSPVDAKIELASGSIRVSRGGTIEGDKSRISIATPTFVAMLYGTTTSEVLASVRDEKTVDLFVLQGRAALRGLDSPEDATGVSLGEGFVTTINENAEASDPRQYEENELPLMQKIPSDGPPPRGFLVNLFYIIVAIVAIFLGVHFGKSKICREDY